VNLGEINSWLTLVANLGVLAGLILVAMQIRQNTKVVRAQVANDWFLADMQLELAMMGENPAESWTKAVYAPGELTRQDAAVLDRYFNYGLVQLQRLHQMNERGMADDRWKDRASYLRWHLGNDVGRRWWVHFREGFPPEFVAMVEASLEGSGFSDNQDLLDSLVGDQPPAI
jgi:hypothetical protein